MLNLTEQEKSALKLIADNQLLYDTVKRVILTQFSVENLPTNMSNENLGQVVRARVDGSDLVESGFRVINQFKSSEPRVDAKNPAR